MTQRGSKKNSDGKISDYLGDVLRSAGLDKRSLSMTDKARRAWFEVAGDVFRERTAVRSFRKGCLVIDVDGSAFLQELQQFEKDRLLEAIRKHLPQVQLLAFKLADS